MSDSSWKPLDALSLAHDLRERLVELYLSEHHVTDPALRDTLQRVWAGAPAEGGVVGRLWVEGAFPARRSDKTLTDLAAADAFPAWLARHLDEREVFPGDRPLFTHQLEALERAAVTPTGGGHPAVLVSAGTGAGKTEAFLLPLLRLLARPRTPGAAGVRAILVYPLNALVNDQVDRVHDWLKGQSEITVFHFTRETPENKRQADRVGYPGFDASRFRTRKQARGLENAKGEPTQGGPVPDVLITNYSMLEYMLCRPQDAVLFGSALEVMVLDEAHVYAGTLAAEMSLLVRRVVERCGRTPRDVLALAVSATIGGKDRSPLATFAAEVFSKPVEAVYVVLGEKDAPALDAPDPAAPTPDAQVLAAGPWLQEPTLVPSPDDPDVTVLAKASPEALARLASRLSALVSPDVAAAALAQAGGHPARLLHAALRRAPLVHALAARVVDTGRLELDALSHDLFPGVAEEVASRATIELLRLVAAARSTPSEHPVVPHRLHVVVREPDGLVCCLRAACSAPAERRLPGLGGIASGLHDACPTCEAAVLTLVRCTECGEPALAGTRLGTLLLPIADAQTLGATRWVWSSELGRRPGARPEVLDPACGEILGEGADGLHLWAFEACPRCDATELAPLATVGSVAVTVVAETLLASMPPFPSEASAWLPARGRRLLAFSDSRREAAALGPRLTFQHESLLVRSAVARIVGAEGAGPLAELQELRDELLAQAEKAGPAKRKVLQQQADAVAKDLAKARGEARVSGWADALAAEPVLAEVLDRAEAEKHRADEWTQEVWEQNRAAVAKTGLPLIERELAFRPRKSHSLESLGLVEVVYPGLDSVPFPDALGASLPADAAATLEGAWTDLLAALCDHLRTDGCVHLHSDEADAEHPHAFFALGRWCAREASGAQLVAFVGESEAKLRQRFAAAVLRAAGLPDTQARGRAGDLLGHAYDALFAHALPLDAPAEGSPFAWLRRDAREVAKPRGKGKKKAPAVAVDCLRIHFDGLEARQPKADSLFRCARTGEVWPRSVLGCAPWPAGLSALAPVEPAALDEDARLRRARQELLESPVFRLALWGEEHSAQLSPQENRRLQDLFRIGARNVLSATTTLELGVDIGGLSGAFLANVPPGLANYLQRAGRAGRRADGSSVVVTFTRSRPFDREVFGRLGDYLGRPLRKPIVISDRERIARRHLHAFLLGEFFRALYPPGKHVGAMSAYGTVRSFFGLPLPPWWEASEPAKPAVPPPGAAVDQPPLVPWWDAQLPPHQLYRQFEAFLAWVGGAGRDAHEGAVSRLLAGTPLEPALDPWPTLLETVRDRFAEVHAHGDQADDLVRRSVVRDHADLLASWEAVDPALDGARRRANAIRFQIKALLETTVIEALADRRFLPRYGFPIHLHRLRVIETEESRGMSGEETFRLERPSLLALREYAPGSKLLVGGRIVHSRGILRHWSGKDVANEPGLSAWLSTCPNGHDYIHLVEAAPTCTVCGEQPSDSPQLLFFPKHGFTTAAWDPPRYGYDVSVAGNSEACAPSISLGVGARLADPAPEGVIRRRHVGGILGLAGEYREEGEILVLNRGRNRQGFALCLACGCAESEREYGEGRTKLPSRFDRHPPIDSVKTFPCWDPDEAPVLRNRFLGARDMTDLLLLDPEHVTLRGDLAPSSSDREAVSTTLAAALQRAGAELLEVDSRELATLVIEQPRAPLPGIVVYDNVPGGAGHVRELLDRAREWFFAALRVLHGTREHHARCDTACFDCLVAFDAPPPERLRRRRAHEVWSHWLAATAGDSEDPRCAVCGAVRLKEAVCGSCG